MLNNTILSIFLVFYIVYIIDGIIIKGLRLYATNSTRIKGFSVQIRYWFRRDMMYKIKSHIYEVSKGYSTIFRHKIEQVTLYQISTNNDLLTIYVMQGYEAAIANITDLTDKVAIFVKRWNNDLDIPSGALCNIWNVHRNEYLTNNNITDESRKSSSSSL